MKKTKHPHTKRRPLSRIKNRRFSNWSKATAYTSFTILAVFIMALVLPLSIYQVQQQTEITQYAQNKAAKKPKVKTTVTKQTKTSIVKKTTVSTKAGNKTTVNKIAKPKKGGGLGIGPNVIKKTTVSSKMGSKTTIIKKAPAKKTGTQGAGGNAKKNNCEKSTGQKL